MLRSNVTPLLRRSPLLRRLPLIYGRTSAPLGSYVGRNYSTDGSKLVEDHSLNETETNDEAHTRPTVDTKPWYLTMVERDRSQNLSAVKKEEIKFPDSSPLSLIRITEYLRDEMGLKDILIFDLQDSDDNNFNTAVAKLSDFVVIATARSAKHCQKSFIQLNAMLKHKFNSVAYVEGNVNAKEERKKIKRMARKSNLSKSWGASSGSTSTGFGKDSDAWFMIDCHVDNIFVNILTDKRRHEMNLEELYAPENERSKYQTRLDNQKVPDGLEDNGIAQVSDENNILLGLRRLAYQRRQYSTSASTAADSLKNALNEKNFSLAHDIVEENSEHLSLPLLKATTDALSNLNVTTNAINDTAKWQAVFENCWPLVLPSETSFQYWALRLKFLKMLNIANPQSYPCSRLIDDYLIRKKSTGFHVSRDDLLQFLQMVKINLNILEKGNYWDLVRSNGNIVSALKNLGEASLIKDDLIVSMLIKTMVLENDTSIKLHSLYEVIDFLCSQPDNMSCHVIVTILETLASIKDWNKFFQFWEVGIKGIIPGQDYRPWSKFVRILVNSNDVELMCKLIDEGHLLWLRRNEVEMTPELMEQLEKLFSKTNYDLKLYLDV